MKVTKFSALAALILMAPFAQEASALPPTTPLTPTDVQLYISGSSALQPVVAQFAKDKCITDPITKLPTDLDVYKDIDPTGGATLGGNWRSYFCTLDSAKSGLPAGTKMLLNNRNKGGSIWGVNPVHDNTTIAYMNINNGNCTPTSLGNYSCTVSALSSDINPATGECSGTGTSGVGSVVCRTSTAGISDVEPEMFKITGVNLPAGFVEKTNFPQFVPNTTRFSENGVIFGILATEGLYRSLQIAQGKIPPTATVADWNPTLRPSMKKTEVATILKGDLTNWLDVNKKWTTAGVSGAMAICRRTAGSGTQAGANAYFLENICRNSSLLPGSIAMVGYAKSIPGYQVVENASTGSLLTCLNSAYNGVNILPLGTPGGADFIGLRHDAIGFAGIDISGGTPPRPVHSVTPQPTDDNFGFVSLDGVQPDLPSAISGDYTYWYENTMQWRNTLNPPTPNQLALLKLFQQTAASPVSINTIPLPGVAALPTSLLWDLPANYPTMRGTRSGNSCQDVILTKSNF